MHNRDSKAYKLMYEAIIRKVILDQFEIGEDIYYKANLRDDLDLDIFGWNLVYKMQELISRCNRRTEER